MKYSFSLQVNANEKVIESSNDCGNPSDDGVSCNGTRECDDSQDSH